MSDKVPEVTEMESPSPASSAISTSSTSTDSDSTSESAPLQPEINAECHILEEEEEEEEEEEGEVDGEENNDEEISIYQRGLPPLVSRSASPLETLEMEEQRRPAMDFPLSQRVFCSPTCKISTGLQQQCSELWNQFDGIGTEMIVTRRGR